MLPQLLSSSILRQGKSRTTTVLLFNDNKGNGTTAFNDQSSKHLKFTSTGGAPAYTTTNPPSGMTSSVGFAADFNAVKNNELLTKDLEIGFKDFTCELMLRNEDIFSRTIVDMQRISGYEALILFSGFNDGTLTWNWANVELGTLSGVAQNTWYHVAICRKNRKTRMFLDGVQGPATISDNHAYRAGSLFLGRNRDSADPGTRGKICSFRLTIGYARYDRNFTVPTLPLKVES